MRKVTWLILLSALCAPLRAQMTLDSEAVKKMVVFIYRADASGNVEKGHPMGTGFLIAPPVKGGTPPTSGTAAGKSGLLLVTARHIIDPDWLYCSEPQPKTIYIRVNIKNYDPNKDESGIDYIPVSLVENGKKKYFVREDDDRVDAAVIDVLSTNLSQDKHDFIPMRLSVLASDDEIKMLKIGDYIASAGLLPGRSGEKRNYPFFKFGAISNIPEEPTWTGCGGRLELRLERAWFIAANLVGGNSGSPIFYMPPPLCLMSGITCTHVAKRAMIIGIQSSSIGDPLFGGADIAAMTPIEDVFKIIEQHSPPNADLYRGDDTQRK